MRGTDKAQFYRISAEMMPIIAAALQASVHRRSPERPHVYDVTGRSDAIAARRTGEFTRRDRVDGVDIGVLRAAFRRTVGDNADPVTFAAAAIAQRAWRNSEVEFAHAGNGLDRISDGEMFAASVVMFRIVHAHLCEPRTEWSALELEVTEEGQPPHLWLAVHAWHEGALQTLADLPDLPE